MYKVITPSDKKHEIESRMEAVKMAKRISRRKHDRVKVIRGNGHERMVFLNGRLEEGVYVTRDRRNRMGQRR